MSKVCERSRESRFGYHRGVGTDLDEALVQTAPAPASPRIEQTATDGARRPIGPELVAGMRLGHFQITKKLGAGGMGEVYLATDLALDRPVAIKVLPAETTSGTAHDRMVREARAQARVMHKNVAHLYFIGEDSGRLYFAMEYVTGETLADRTAKGPVPVEEALGLIHDAVLGLREAQRSGFTHRDVKPSNLMVDSHGVVKVLDFGLAAGAPEHAGSGGPVAQTTLAGTPLYMAPEQARGEPVDFRADIYALGATLFQLVCGRPPFQAQTALELRTMHESAERPTLRGVVPRTQSTALDALIARMMAPRPEDRFASYDELLHAIELASTQYTRPAGFWVRAAALGIDMLLVAIISTLAHNLIAGNGDYSMSLYGVPFAAVLQLLVLGRWGTTIGFALLELEVVAVDTGRKPTWRAALVRTLWMYGPLIAVAWLIELATLGDVRRLVVNLGRFVYVTMMGSYALHLIYSALRRPGKRTDWDRRSGTMVRYRTSRVRGAGG
jgi:uncharacterized RDD family membrane protein YckC